MYYTHIFIHACLYTDNHTYVFVCVCVCVCRLEEDKLEGIRNKKREGTSRRRGQEEREKVREIACTYDEESLQC